MRSTEVSRMGIKEREDGERERETENIGAAYMVRDHLILESESTTTTTTIDCLSIMVCGRFSNKVDDETFEDAKEGNNIVLRKFIQDFVSPIPVLATESVFWKGRKAWAPLPWISVDDDDEAVQYPAGEFQNSGTDSLFCNFLNTRPDFSLVVLIIRGIDGASIEPGTWLFLQNRYPKLRIALAFTCTELFVRERVPEGEQYFWRSDPFDGRLYGVFYLDKLVSAILRMSQDSKYRWLLNEFKLGKLYRGVLSMAKEGGDADEIANAHSQFKTLHTSRRNDLPIIAEPLQHFPLSLLKSTFRCESEASICNN
jgi:hypothetical protein